jgi:hypothetical protein
MCAVCVCQCIFVVRQLSSLFVNGCSTTKRDADNDASCRDCGAPFRNDDEASIAAGAVLHVVWRCVRVLM